MPLSRGAEKPSRSPSTVRTKLESQWLAPVVVLRAAATPSRGKAARPARSGTFAATKPSRNGTPAPPRRSSAASTSANPRSSRNCTKHQVRCDYNDNPASAAPDSPKGPQQPNLLWTPEIEATINIWQSTGEFPFPELNVYPQPQWRNYSKTDLRLIHHLSSISNEMFRGRTSKLTVWAENMPK